MFLDQRAGIVAAALVLGYRLVPESRDPNPGALDVPGVLLSIGGLGALVWAVIEALGDAG